MGPFRRSEDFNPSPQSSSDPIDDERSILNPIDEGQDLEAYLPHEEIAEIVDAVCPGRAAELANVVRLGHTVTLRWEVTCLATVIDMAGTRLSEWTRFKTEVVTPPAYMWSDDAYLEPPVQGLLEPGLSYPTRLLLAALAPAGVTFRRTREDLREKYLFSTSDIETVTRELRERDLGSWKLPTLRDSADWLTVADLEPLLVEAPVKKSWTKARKLDVLLETADHGKIRELVVSVSPWALEEQLFIRYETLAPEGFHRAWATLAGHYLGMCAYRNRDWDSSRTTLSSFGSNTVKLSVPAPVDECDRCKTSRRRASLDDRSTWPPFHLGCRCIANVEF